MITEMGHSGTVVTCSAPTSAVSGSNPGPNLGKLVIGPTGWQFTAQYGVPIDVTSAY